MEKPSKSKYTITGVSFTLLAMVFVAGGSNDPYTILATILLSIVILIYINYEYIKLFNYVESLKNDGKE